MTGVLACAGVVVNDSLVLVTFMNRLRDSGATVMEAAARDYMKEKMREESNARAMGKARAMDARDLCEVRETGRGREMRALCRVTRVACGFERRLRRDAREEMRVDSRLD